MFGRKRKGDSGLDKIRETTDLAVDVENLVVKYVTSEETVEAVNSIDLKLKRKRTLGLVGETGAGKTTAMLALMNMVPSPPGVITEGSIKVNGLDMRKLTPAQLQAVRGSEIAMIFQDPMTSLNPVLTVGDQIAESISLHRNLSKVEVKQEVGKLLAKVGIDPRRASEYPHQFSGGMRQRAAFARTVLTGSDLLLLDEPFSALDYLTRLSMREWLLEQWEKEKKTVLFITHDVEEAVFLSSRILVVEQSPITHLRSIEVPAGYPRSREELRRPEILSLKEELIGMLKKEKA